MLEPLAGTQGIRRTAKAESLCSFSYLLKIVLVLFLLLSCLLIKRFDFVMCFPLDKRWIFCDASTSPGGMPGNQNSISVTAVSQCMSISLSVADSSVYI